MIDIRECDQDGCHDVAVFEVFWPGKNPPPVYCVMHTARAEAMLSASGIYTTVRSLPAPAHTSK